MIKIKKICILLTLPMLLFSCRKIENEALVEKKSTNLNDVTTITTTTDEVVTTTEIKPEDVKISFSCTGDNLIHSSIYEQASIRAGGGGNYDFTRAYENIADLIQSPDVAVLNQETLICNDIFSPSSYPCFNSPTALGNHMIDLGFDVFSTANNHTLDKGVDGLLATLDYWDSKENSTVVGVYRNLADKENIRTRDVKGVKFSFLNYTEYLNGLSLPEGSEIIIGDAFNIDGMVEDVKKAKSISDICVVCMHWGVEDSDVISDTQRDVAQILANAGADIIIGNHPHVLRDIEMVTANDGTQTICAYSLGNLISAQSNGQNLIGGFLSFDIDINTSDDLINFENVKFIPVVTHYDYNYSDVRLYKFSDYTRELADAHGVNSNSAFGYDFIVDILKTTINNEYLVLD